MTREQKSQSPEYPRQFLWDLDACRSFNVRHIDLEEAEIKVEDQVFGPVSASSCLGVCSLRLNFYC